MKYIFFSLLPFLWIHPGLLAQSWTEMGPFNRAGVMNHLFLDEPTKKLYASSPDGGVWVYNDFTNTTLNWAPITDEFSNLEIIASTIVWDIVQPNTFAIGGDWRLSRSVIINYGMRGVFDKNLKFKNFQPVATISCMMR